MTKSDEQRDAARLDWIDDVADRFEAAWHQRPEIEPYLQGTNHDDEVPLLLELIKIDLEYRGRIGEPQQLELY